MIRREEALEYHAAGRPGKVEVRATKPCLTRREVGLAYLPGAAFPSKEIAGDPAAAFRYTSRGNLVGVVTNGTAVPGLGPVGPLAAKPMQEGVAVLTYMKSASLFRKLRTKSRTRMATGSLSGALP